MMFITFEGIDGSGKSTQIGLLADELRKKNKSVVCLREPGSTIASEQIRRLLLDVSSQILPTTEVMLFCAARAQVTSEVIVPELAKGSVVICDRYIDSTVAYQGYGRNVNIEAIHTANAFATNSLYPDLTFYLDVSPELAQSRTISREKDRLELENISFFEKVRNGYLTLCKDNAERIKLLDSNLTLEEMHEKILSFVNEKMN